MKKNNMRRKNLFRVDVHLSYLVYTDKETYNEIDVCKWLKNDFHSGELDEEGALEVQKVKSIEQIQDFLEKDFEYNVYYTDDKDDGTSIQTLVDELSLDADVLVAKLRKLGYTVAPPKEK
jgi:hypothetical protein